jgi:hypothetical protein
MGDHKKESAGLDKNRGFLVAPIFFLVCYWKKLRDKIRRTEKEITYHIRVQCPACKIVVIVCVEGGEWERAVRNGDHFFGPCPGCKAPFLKIVGI